jgi:hypothetical protein
MATFTLDFVDIKDLFYDGSDTNPEDEYEMVVEVLDSDIGKSVLESVYREPMNRRPFQTFASKM